MNSKKSRSIACEECHKKKVRCSGGEPQCDACRSARIECVYPVKSRSVKVSQRYIDAILEDNRRLSAAVEAGGSTGTVTPAIENVSPRPDEADRNPVVEKLPWFVPVGSVDLPVHIGEAADAAFATRLRQAVSGRPVNHLPRVHYLSDDVLYAHISQSTEWPGSSRLQFLVEVALKMVCSRWHIVRRSTVLANVKKLLSSPDSCDRLVQCKIWVLLALGEAYSARCVISGSFPGVQYWTRAMSMINIVPERPRLEVVEIYLLLAVYASCLNRRHTSIIMASSAVRICIILGLHLEIDQSQLQDPVLREHRCRLWWTAYRYDRLWASKIGWPPSISDDSIEIGLPSNLQLSIEIEGDFEDSEYSAAAIRLAGLLSYAITTLYVRKRHPTSFTERVQAAIRSLRDWSDTLPVHLRLESDTLPQILSDHLLYLHLAFNQAVIVITRPILFHVLKQRRGSEIISDSAWSLTTACIRRARQSMKMLRRSWTDGTFLTFDYFFAQFLFSAAIILGISSLLQDAGWEDDRQEFLLAHSFLHQLEQNGNFAAREFCNHTDAIEQVLQETLAAGQATSTPAIPRMDEQLPLLSTQPLQDFLDVPNLNFEAVDIAGDLFDWQNLLLPDMQHAS